MIDFRILILTNSNSDLTKLKFKDFKIINIISLEFIELCKKSFTREDEFLNKINDEYKNDAVERYALIHKEQTLKFGVKKLYSIHNFLILMFPSTLSIEYILDYQIVQSDIRYLSSYHIDRKNYDKDEFLTFDDSNIDNINKYIERYYETYLNVNYVKFSIQHYLNAFDSNYVHFSFVAFCISLESITNGTSELLYRIARNIAIICGKDIKTSNIVFKNIKKIYTLRSKIVHGSDFSDEIVFDYMTYLQSICSKTLIELISHNVNNIDDLNNKITELGFGDRNKISENWNEIKINEKIDNIIYKTL
jgi:hypothetical protein